MRKSILIVLFALTLLFSSVASSFASSSYVLPYPGAMPGNKLYKVGLFIDMLKGFYSFGDFAKFKHNLFESDKYLVEAKTLFEYNQYPLAMQALSNSDTYFKNVLPNLILAKNHGKDIFQKLELFSQARNKHVEVLQKLKLETPRTFLWRDEKKDSIQLNISEKIDQSITTRLNTRYVQLMDK